MAAIHTFSEGAARILHKSSRLWCGCALEEVSISLFNNRRFSIHIELKRERDRKMRVTLESLLNENAPVLRLPLPGKCACSQAMRYLIIENSAVRSSLSAPLLEKLKRMKENWRPPNKKWLGSSFSVMWKRSLLLFHQPVPVENERESILLFSLLAKWKSAESDVAHITFRIMRIWGFGRLFLLILERVLVYMGKCGSPASFMFHFHQSFTSSQ